MSSAKRQLVASAQSGSKRCAEVATIEEDYSKYSLTEVMRLKAKLEIKVKTLERNLKIERQRFHDLRRAHFRTGAKEGMEVSIYSL